ncbi:3-oxoacyl-[acyl-carrier protein] reductase [Desulfacinum infernum DSM 9756]|uniref:3-oxoacyl-[acyl-carrier protein] reductase n=1 Tax=Desulfacinum infernum DSM 9756 TaxID=1121391 RepID=A0A1M4ZLY2_9BACT|nr:SDR family NAD(P)-dependent oxidoreductase [Desulfacinum infernum]SHF18812.1 3-oxoacyl-[acyl-carrier protein] reductase [Desulfacinum infernum DSM 9756]
MLEIANAVAVITGGSGGIGKALAQYWIRNGGRVVLADIAEDALEKTARELRDAGGEVVTVLCNVTSEEDNARLADTAMEAFGAINLVAPFAGIIADGLLLAPDRETGKVTRKMSLEQFQKVVDINLTGVFLTVRECAERMINHGCRGLICLVSSTGSLGTAGQINYSSTKAAMSVFPKVITAEFFRRGIADRIRCVAVAPGYVGTPMVRGMNQKALEKILNEVPIGRLIEPEEVASLVGELYRNEALAGDVYFIHGGLRLGSRG